MALTIRTTEADDVIIDRAMIKFGFNTKSKALIQCVPIALKLHEDKRQLERELEQMKEKLSAIHDVFEEKMIADSSLARLILDEN